MDWIVISGVIATIETIPNASVIIYSVIQTALLNNLKPENYLEYVFGQIQINRDTDLNDLMPWSEKIPEECKNKLQK